MRKITTILLLCLSVTLVQAQIIIGGNIYGGGNAGDTGGKTTVNIYAGDLHNVYGGARQANVGGSAFLHIDGEHASNYIVIDKAYGGNDIAGTIGTSENLPLKTETSDGMTEVGTEAGKNDIDPKSVFGVFQFEVKKKTREFVLAEGSLLGGIQSTTSFNTVPTQVKKYGTESYLVVIENAEPGQYAFTTTDISYVSTFGVE